MPETVSAPVGDPDHSGHTAVRPVNVPGYLLGVLTVGNVLSYTDRAVLAVLVQPIQNELHIDDAQTGLLTGIAFALFYGFVAMPVGWLADRYSRPRILVAGITVWSLATILSGFARNFTMLLLCRIGVGAGEAGNSPTSHALIADTFDRAAAPTAFAVFAFGSTIGFVLGLTGGGWLGQWFGWRWAFVIAGLPGLVLALLVACTIREPRGLPTFGRVHENVGMTLRALAANRTFRMLTLSYALWIFLFSASLQWIPALLIRKFGMGLGEVGTLFGFAFGLGSGVGSLIGGYVGGRLATRDPQRLLWLPMLSAVAHLPFYGFGLFCPDKTLAIVSLFTASVLCSLGVGPLFAALQSVVSPSRRGMAGATYGLLSSVIGIGGAPVLIGLISQQLKPSVGPVLSLQYAIAIAMMASLFFLATLLLSGRTLRGDQDDTLIIA